MSHCPRRTGYLDLVASVLVIEDDPVVARVMLQHLRHAGFDVEWVEDGERGLKKLRYERPDVAVIDMMLPGLDGWAVTETARRERIGTPIIAVSARGSEHDKVHTLGIGADDYLAKPFGMRELVARVQAALRRSGGMADDRGAAIEVDGLRIEPDQRRAFLRTDANGDDGWADAVLTPTEFRLLLALAKEQGRVLTRDELQQRVWGTRPRHRDRTVDVCVRKLREKLDRRSPTHEYLHTQYGVGYRFGAEPKA
ncbi:MAG: two-component system, OmpR family, alkaline phosphatase synthesis response regulator PhoP [Gaiellaceae bacterium]|nr:two-component system, OmpR family, alkaline phosphatase synthesis response regulator PhoP [Gaiellaceae bacterium]